MLNRQRLFRVRTDSVQGICGGVLTSVGRIPSGLTVAFVGPAAMQRMNRRYRGRDYPTDVLSFALETGTVDGLPYLGELVIAPFVALENSQRWGTSAEAEIRRLLVHGTLHLLGYDHEADEGEMNRLQRRLLRRAFVVGAAPVAILREPR